MTTAPRTMTPFASSRRVVRVPRSLAGWRTLRSVLGNLYVLFLSSPRCVCHVPVLTSACMCHSQDMATHNTVHDWLEAPYTDDYFSNADSELLAFMHMWVTATSGLFGPDMMSLRPMSKLMVHFRQLVSPHASATGGASGGSDDVAIDLTPLVLLLQSKQSTLPMPFCRAMVEALWSFRLRGNRVHHLWEHVRSVFTDLEQASPDNVARIASKWGIDLPRSGTPTRGAFLDAFCRRLGGTIQV